MKNVALTLGLQENAGEADVLAAVNKLKSDHRAEVETLTTAKNKAEEELKTLRDGIEAERKAEAAGLVDAAIEAGKITAELKETYLGLFAKDHESTKKAIEAISGRTKLSDLAGKAAAAGTAKYADLSWDELDRKGLLAELKERHPLGFKTA